MIYTFADSSLDTDRRELRRSSALVPVEPQVFDLVHHLISQRDRVVSKDELIAKVWGGRMVSDSAITSRITAARQAIGDSGAAQRLIRTIPRKGLRFVGEVREEQSRPHGRMAEPSAGPDSIAKLDRDACADRARVRAPEMDASPQPATTLSSSQAAGRWRRAGASVVRRALWLRGRSAAPWLAATAALLVAAGFGLMELWRPDSGSLRATAAYAPADRAHGFPSTIEVLPFFAGSGDQGMSELADRLTDDLTGYLSRVHWLQVIARHAGTQQSERQGRDSGARSAQPAARYVLNGTVREQGDTIRLNITLIDALLRLEVWSHHFVESRAKWENLQDDVLRRVTYAVYIEALRRGGGDLSDQRNEPTVDQLIARGWARLLAGSDWVLFDEAGPAFREALRREPESATGMIGLAAFYVLAVSELKLAREPYLAEAENLLRRTLARHPYNHSVHYYLGIVHFLHGNMPAALQAFDQALEINPSFPPGYARRGRVLIMLQKYQEALDSIRYALRLNGVTIVAGWQLWAGLAELELAQDNEARQSLQKVVAALPQNPYVRASLAALHALSGEWPEARRQVETLRSRTPQLSDQQRLFRFNAGPGGKPLQNRLGNGLRLALEAHPEAQ